MIHVFLNSEECQTVSNALAISRVAMYVGDPLSLHSAVTSVTINDARVGEKKPSKKQNGSLFCFVPAAGSSISAMICTSRLPNNDVTGFPQEFQNKVQ